MEWMILPYKRYADFSGRSRRKEYWMFAMFYAAVFLVLMFSALFSSFPIPEDSPTQEIGSVGITLFVLLAVFALVSFIPALAVQVRRFHDQDKSGWLILLNFVPYIGGFVVLVFMCLEGTRGENSYGPDPKGWSNAGTFD